jgi:succinoglycan biosynthesis transport protein ExoP
MQPQDPQGVTRRPLDVEDYIDILRRHKAWIFGPAFAALVVAVVVAFLWPDTYVSSAVIRVVPPQVSESYVQTPSTTDMQGRISSMTQVILSRATLTNIINSYGLYKKEQSRMPLDDVVEAMRAHDIKIGAVQSLTQMNGRNPLPAFQIGFAYNNRFIAQKVTTDLVSRFLEENTREQTQNVMGAQQFLADQWTTAKKKLDEIEGKLSGFRARNLGHLPEEQQANYQQLNTMQAQMLNLNQAMSRVSQEKLLLENQLRIYKDQANSLKDPAQNEQAMQQKNEKLAEKDREIATYEAALAAARERYKETHPDIQTLLTRIANANKQREAIVKEQETKKPDTTIARQPNPQFVREGRDLNAAIQRIDGLIQAKDLEMQDYQKEAAKIAVAMKAFQGRIEGMPAGMKEYEELLRDREMARRDYEELDRKVNSADLYGKAVGRQQGERLEMLDPATLPQTPTEPKRPVIILAGAGLGLILGLFFAGAREVKDTSLKNLKDVRAYTQLPILGSIPLLENDLVVRRRRRLGWLAWSTACLMGVVVMSGSVVYYYATKL